MDLPARTLSTDSSSYELLYAAACETALLPGASCEIGVREGGSSELILMATQANKSSRIHIAIDPWGGMPYPMGGGLITGRIYPDAMRQRTLANLYALAHQMELDLIVFPWCDTDFYERCAEGVPFYREETSALITSYNLVHIDGPHSTEAVMNAATFFAGRMVDGGQLVFDDVAFYDHASVHEFLVAVDYHRTDDGLTCRAVYRR